MKARNGSAVLWLLVIGLVAFVIFNVFSKADVFKGFKLIHKVATNVTTGGVPVTSEGGGVSVNEPKPIPPLNVSPSDLSPLYKKVRIGSVTAPSPFPGTGGQFTLFADYSLKDAVDVTGWTVIGNKGGTVSVPQAISDYNPNMYSQIRSDIMLDPGGIVYVYGSESALNNNIRLNKCTGYLNERYNMNPILPNECPLINDSQITLLSGQCQNYLRSLSACVTPKAGELNLIGSGFEEACRVLINTQNQGSCYNNHRLDAGFFEKEWRAWNGNSLPFDMSHDRLILRDKNGLVVDEYTY